MNQNDPTWDWDEFYASILETYKGAFDDDFDVLLLWGGRDGGKTYALMQLAISECISLDYFRCIMIKKTYESIKDSQFQGLKDYIHALGIEHWFEFRTSPLSIVCKRNGNSFIARGCDKPEKIRGISNPSHAWYEEGNQLTEEDYINVSTSLRTNKGRVCEWFSFNPEAKGIEFEDFWVYRYFFKGINKLTFSTTKNIEIESENGDKKMYPLRIKSIHSTYKDNIFCTPDRIARHESLKRTNPHYYRVFTLGLWGNEENNTPYFMPFNVDKHVSESIEIVEDEELWFSFDFNLDPCTVVVGQKIRFDGLKVIDVIQDSKGTRSLCEKIMQVEAYRDHPALIKVTGDNSGYSGSSVGGVNSAGENINDMLIIYEVFSKYVHTFKKSHFVRYNKANRAHELSRTLCNEIYDSDIVKFDSEFCGPLIKEIQKAIPDPSSQKLFKNRKKGYEMDMVDAKRYLFNAWFPKQLKDLRSFVEEIRS